MSEASRALWREARAREARVAEILAGGVDWRPRDRREAPSFFSRLKDSPLLRGAEPALVQALWREACSWAYRGLSVGDREFVRAIVLRHVRSRQWATRRGTTIHDIINQPSDGWSDGCIRTFERLRWNWRILGDAYDALVERGALTGEGRNPILDHVHRPRHIPEGGDRPDWEPRSEADIALELLQRDEFRVRRMTATLDRRCGQEAEPGFMAWMGWAHPPGAAAVRQVVWCRRSLATCTVGRHEAVLSTRPGFLMRVVPLGLAAPPPGRSACFPVGLDEPRDAGAGAWLAEGWWVTRSHAHAPPTRGWLAWCHAPDGSGRVDLLATGRTAEAALRNFWRAHGPGTPADRALAWCPEPPPEALEMAPEDAEAFEGLW